MKTAIWIIVVLILIAGAVFYFGWVRIEPETFGVAHSTITGTVEYPLESGHLYWFWQKLIPKSFNVFVLKKEPHDIQFQITTPLPKSGNLSEFGSFTLGMRIDVQYTVDFESALALYDHGLLTGFQPFFQEEVKTLAEEASSSFIVEGMTRYAYSVRTFDYTMLDNLKTELARRIQNSAGVYDLKNVNVTVIYSEIPQLDIYVEALKKYYAYVDKVYAEKEQVLQNQLENQKKLQQEDVEIARLRKYGELLSEYPVVLKYLYIEKFGERAEVVVLPENQQTGFLPMLEPGPPATAPSPRPQQPEAQKPPAPQIQPEGGAGGAQAGGTTAEGAQAGGGTKESQAETPESAPSTGGTQEQTQSAPKKKKWYEYLKFWKDLKL